MFFFKSQKIGKQCNYFNYFDCWKVEGAVNLEDVEDSVEKQPSLVGNLKNQQDCLGESLENSNCNLARWKGNVQRRKRRTWIFTFACFFFMENLIRWTIRFPQVEFEELWFHWICQTLSASGGETSQIPRFTFRGPVGLWSSSFHTPLVQSLAWGYPWDRGNCQEKLQSMGKKLLLNCCWKPPQGATQKCMI